ncbi:MAG: histidine--tRNA ligase [Candidatus Ratteibacteria bacterium]
MTDFKRLRGMHDILPDEIWKWKKVESVFIEICELFGFREIRTPVLESKFLFERGIGRNTDIVMKEMYEFKDKKGREIALRPEGTASVVRAYVENQIYNKEKITKIYYLGPMFRYDRPQKGRYRQFYQFGAEIFGGKGPFFDGETVEILDIAFKKLKIGNFTFLINSLGCKECKGIYVEELKKYLNKNLNNLCKECQIRTERNPLRVLDCKNSFCRLIFENIPSILDFLCNECKFHFHSFIDFLSILKINFKIDSKLVRGLDYYTRTVFEVISEENIAIAGGGRYDYLVKEIGGPDIPAVGFAVGIDRVVPLIKQEFKDETSVYLIFLGERARNKGVEIMKKFIENKIKVEADYEERSLSEYLRIANKTGKKWCIILGDNEVDKGIVLIKNMENGIQEEIKQENIIEKIKEKIKC